MITKRQRIFTLIFPYDVTALLYPGKSSGTITVNVVMHVEAKGFDSAQAKAIKLFNKPLLFTATIEGRPLMEVENSKGIIWHPVELVKLYPPYDGPQER